MQNPNAKSHKHFFAFQFCLRGLATVATLAATFFILTSKQTVVVLGIVADARYSYSSAYRFFAFANLAACVLSAVSLLVHILGRKSTSTKKWFMMFLHDFVLTILLMAGCAAATAVGYIGKYGNIHTGWTAICDNFSKFCKRVTLSVTISYLAVVFYILLTIASAHKSRHIQPS